MKKVFFSSPGVIAEIEKDVLQEIGRILRPVDSEPVHVGVVQTKVLDQGLEVIQDVGACQTSVAGQTAARPGPIGKARLVVLFRSAKLDPIAGWDRGLHLKVDTESPGTGFLHELGEEVTLLPGER